MPKALNMSGILHVDQVGSGYLADLREMVIEIGIVTLDKKIGIGGFSMSGNH